jgi:T-complex protein 1 subunit theta
MNKMVINHLEKLFVTSDAATIVRELEVAHPAAKLVVLAAQAQEAEIGDGTNLVSRACAAESPGLCLC